MKTVVLTHAAAKELDSLPDDGRQIVLHGLNRYAVSGRGDIKALVGTDKFRLRVGRYRVIFAEDAVTVLATYIGKRETTTYRRG